MLRFIVQFLVTCLGLWLSSRVEAGAQGEHKIARGYLPSPVYSAHFIADPALRGPVARYLDGERPAVAAEIEAMTAELSPFRQTE